MSFSVREQGRDMPDFIPRSDVLCLAWSAQYAQGIAAEPERFYISSDDAAELVAAQAAFARAMAVATSPGTRTRVAIADKDAARLAMEAVVRRTATVARAVLVNDRATLLVLGLAVGPGRSASRRVIGPPKSEPRVYVKQVQGASVSIVLHNPDAPSKRGLAAGIFGATLYSYVGDEPPVRIAEWRMHRILSRTDTTLNFGTSYPPGTKVWICAQWMNPRSQAGPVSDPVYAHFSYAMMNSATIGRAVA